MTIRHCELSVFFRRPGDLLLCEEPLAPGANAGVASLPSVARNDIMFVP